MPSGGARQGQPGKSYSNRTDLNVDRAPQPGSSGQMPETSPLTGSPQPPMMLPDDIPTLDTPTQFPDEPVTAGLPFGEGPNSPPVPPPINTTMIMAALRRMPADPDLQRLAAFIQVRDA